MSPTRFIQKLTRKISTTLFVLLEVLGLPRIPQKGKGNVRGGEKK